jgi:hypothetical protein
LASEHYEFLWWWKKTNTGWWFFNQLVNCTNEEQICQQRDKHLNHISTKAIGYLNKLEDTSQYPAARCAMHGNIYMYSQSASSGNESMNHANSRARERIAINLVNATMVLVNLESQQFEKKWELAWNSNEILTPKGKALRDEAFKEVNVNNYVIVVTKEGEHFVDCIVRKGIQQSKLQSADSITCGAGIMLWVMHLRVPKRYGCAFRTHGGHCKKW